jgi:hypothetical protein
MPSLEKNRKQVRIAMKRANQFPPTLSIVCLALTPLGCTKTDSLGAAGSADASVESRGATVGATALDGNAQEAVFIVLPDASTFTFTFAELPDSGSTTHDDGTCPLLFPNLVVHYPSEVDSP